VAAGGNLFIVIAKRPAIGLGAFLPVRLCFHPSGTGAVDATLQVMLARTYWEVPSHAVGGFRSSTKRNRQGPKRRANSPLLPALCPLRPVG